MSTSLDEEVQYSFNIDGEKVILNDWIGKEVALHFTGEINCIDCGKLTNKSFGQGFCYPCFMNSPQNSPCIIRPELCEAHEGKGRDVEWEETHHNRPHFVYLAKSSGVKVGVTREDQIPTRWIDQGASEGIKLAYVPYRQLAGEIEVLLKEFISDKTNWQRMLKNQISSVDLLDLKEEMIENLPEEYHDFIADDDDVISLNYPVYQYPTKVQSIKLEKVNQFKAVLKGIKGQYLIFEGGIVINLRNHSGFKVSFSVTQ